MKNVSDITEAFGGVPAFSKFFDVNRQTVHTWVRRNFLPAHLDLELINEAKRRKISLTLEDLAKMRARVALD